jgi:hypothetical protein
LYLGAGPRNPVEAVYDTGVRRLGLLGAASALSAVMGCASTTAPNPPGPPPPGTRPYAGRIVLSTPALPEAIDAFHDSWSQRLSILGLPSRIVYDDTRAIFDIYGAPPASLAGLAGALADPGGWMDHALDNAFLAEWTAPTPACNCGGEMSVSVGGGDLCNWRNATGPVEIRRPGSASFWVAGWDVLWHYRMKVGIGANAEDYAEGDTPSPKRGLECPKEQWPKRVVFRLLPGTSPEQATAAALALGGRRLPEIPHIDSVVSASGAGPR